MMSFDPKYRIATLKKWFDLNTAPPPGAQIMHGNLANLVPKVGKIVLLVGPSGSGKSTLLREIRAANRARENRLRWVDARAMRVPQCAVVNCLLHLELHEALEKLAEVGLAEAAVLLRKPTELSDGQRFRLRLALAMEHANRSRRACVIACDEFAAALDDVTAGVVAQSLRRIVSASNQFGLIVVTGREQLIASLQPDVVVRCDFGQTEITSAGSPQ